MFILDIVLHQLVTLPFIREEWSKNYLTISKVLIKSMLPSQVIFRAYMFKGCYPLSSIYILVYLPNRPSLC